MFFAQKEALYPKNMGFINGKVVKYHKFSQKN